MTIYMGIDWSREKHYDRLCATYPAAQPAVVMGGAAEAVPLAHALLHSLHNEKENINQLQALFWQHPAAAIFASLPGTG